jgi:hypothetical protein
MFVVPTQNLLPISAHAVDIKGVILTKKLRSYHSWDICAKYEGQNA